MYYYMIYGSQSDWIAITKSTKRFLYWSGTIQISGLIKIKDPTVLTLDEHSVLGSCHYGMLSDIKNQF